MVLGTPATGESLDLLFQERQPPHLGRNRVVEVQVLRQVPALGALLDVVAWRRHG
jgi:hypothetical protein